MKSLAHQIKPSTERLTVTIAASKGHTPDSATRIALVAGRFENALKGWLAEEADAATYWESKAANKTPEAGGATDYECHNYLAELALLCASLSDRPDEAIVAIELCGILTRSPEPHPHSVF